MSLKSKSLPFHNFWNFTTTTTTTTTKRFLSFMIGSKGEFWAFHRCIRKFTQEEDISNPQI
jgi:hypothetical protein